MPNYPNYYEVLGVKQTATEAEIRKAFKTAVLEKHPDKNPNPLADLVNPPDNTGKQIVHVDVDMIKEARNTLVDPDKRAAYDAKLDRDTKKAAQPSEAGETKKAAQPASSPQQEASTSKQDGDLSIRGPFVLVDGKPKNFYEFFGLETGEKPSPEALAAQKDKLLKQYPSAEDQKCIQTMFDTLSNEDKRAAYDQKLRSAYLGHIQHYAEEDELGLDLALAWLEDQSLFGLYLLYLLLMELLRSEYLMPARSYADAKGYIPVQVVELQLVPLSQDNPEETKVAIVTSPRPGNYRVKDEATLQELTQKYLKDMSEKGLKIGEDFEMKLLENKETGAQALMLTAKTEKGKEALDAFIKDSVKSGMIKEPAPAAPAPAWLQEQAKSEEAAAVKSTAPTPFQTQPRITGG